MSILAIIQARVGSSRLPKKMLAPLAGVPLVAHCIRRAKEANLANRTILAIPDTAENDELAVIGESESVEVYRGSEDDLISRFYWAAERYQDAEVIVRLTADDWAKDPDLIDLAVGAFLTEWAERRPKVDPPQLMHLGGLTWALGMDVEVFTKQALHTAYQQAPKYEREHMTQWMARELGVWMLKDPKARSTINTRLTVDDINDFSLATKIAHRLKDGDYSYDSTLAALRAVEMERAA